MLDLSYIFGPNFAQLEQFHTPAMMVLSQHAVILLIAMLIEMFIPIKKRFRLIRFDELFCFLSYKVNKKDNTQEQNLLSGFLLVILIYAVFLIIILLIKFIADFYTIISIVLLTLLLEFHYIDKKAVRFYRLCRDNQIDEAKALAQSMCLRDCQRLSMMGLQKAMCDSIALRLFYGYFAVMIWFLIAGIPGALFMQLSNVLTHCYNKKLAKFDSFGQSIYRIHQAICIIPLFCFLLIVLICTFRFKLILKSIENRNKHPNFITAIYLYTIAKLADVSLLGPRYYEDTLYRYSRLGPSINPDQASALKVLRKVRFYAIILVVISVLVDTFVIV